MVGSGAFRFIAGEYVPARVRPIPAQQQRLFDAIEARATEQVPIVPLGQYFGRTAVQNSASGVRPGSACYSWDVRKAGS